MGGSVGAGVHCISKLCKCRMKLVIMNKWLIDWMLDWMNDCPRCGWPLYTTLSAWNVCVGITGDVDELFKYTLDTVSDKDADADVVRDAWKALHHLMKAFKQGPATNDASSWIFGLLSRKKSNYQFDFLSHSGYRGFSIFSWGRLRKLRGIRGRLSPRTKLIPKVNLIFPDLMRPCKML